MRMQFYAVEIARYVTLGLFPSTMLTLIGIEKG